MLKCTECEFEETCLMREFGENVIGCAGQGKRKECEEE